MRLQVIIGSGGVGERLKPAVLKTVRLERVSGVRIPPPPPLLMISCVLISCLNIENLQAKTAAVRWSHSSLRGRGFRSLGGPGIGHELVSKTSNGYQVPRLGGFALDVAAQTHNKVVYCAGVRVFVEVPDVLQNSFARNGPA